jgi:hypothetical protein
MPASPLQRRRRGPRRRPRATSAAPARCSTHCRHGEADARWSPGRRHAGGGWSDRASRARPAWVGRRWRWRRRGRWKREPWRIREEGAVGSGSVVARARTRNGRHSHRTASAENRSSGH